MKTEAEKQAIADDYHRGMRVVDISNKHGIPPGSVCRIAHHSGCPPRVIKARGWDRPYAGAPDRVKIAEEYKLDKVIDIAKRHGISSARVCQIAYAAGCEPKLPREKARV